MMVRTLVTIEAEEHRRLNAAERFWGRVRAGLAAIETVLPGDLDNAWRIGETFADQAF